MGKKIDCKGHVVCQRKDLVNLLQFMPVICDIEKSLPSGSLFQGHQWLQKWPSPVHFDWSFCPSHGNLV
jgi:hypothetical protein